MRVQVALKMPNNIIRYQIFDGVTAQVNPNTHVLQIFYNKAVIAEFQSDFYVSWQYVVTPQATATSRAGQLLQSHGV